MNFNYDTKNMETENTPQMSSSLTLHGSIAARIDAHVESMTSNLSETMTPSLIYHPINSGTTMCNDDSSASALTTDTSSVVDAMYAWLTSSSCKCTHSRCVDEVPAECPRCVTAIYVALMRDKFNFSDMGGDIDPSDITSLVTWGHNRMNTLPESIVWKAFSLHAKAMEMRDNPSLNDLVQGVQKMLLVDMERIQGRSCTHGSRPHICVDCFYTAYLRIERRKERYEPRKINGRPRKNSTKDLAELLYMKVECGHDPPSKNIKECRQCRELVNVRMRNMVVRRKNEGRVGDDLILGDNNLSDDERRTLFQKIVLSNRKRRSNKK